MNLREFVARLECEFKPQCNSHEIFIAKDDHSVDLRHIEEVTMCRDHHTMNWRRCEVEGCTNERKRALLLL